MGSANPYQIDSMGSVPLMEGAAAGPSTRIRKDPQRSAQADPQPRCPIGGTEPIKSILMGSPNPF
eukprot:368248-Prorocentrum_minimum.AAC.1